MHASSARDTDVVVIGGGIAGLTAALAASAHGVRSIVVDDRRPGAASHASAGMLAPSLPGLPDHVLGVACAARDFLPAFVGGSLRRPALPFPSIAGGSSKWRKRMRSLPACTREARVPGN